MKIAYEKLAKMSRNSFYVTGNLLFFVQHQNYYNFTEIDLSWQTNVTITQKINLSAKLEEDGGVRMFFLIAAKQQKAIPNFTLDSLIVTE